MVAVSGYHLVGIVDEVDAHRCRVRLVTDPGFRAVVTVISIAHDTTILDATTHPDDETVLQGILKGTGRRDRARRTAAADVPATR